MWELTQAKTEAEKVHKRPPSEAEEREDRKWISLLKNTTFPFPHCCMQALGRASGVACPGEGGSHHPPTHVTSLPETPSQTHLETTFSTAT